MPDITDPELPGDGEPEGDSSEPVLFTLTVGREALDEMCRACGIVATTDLRLTIAQEFNKRAVPWLLSVVEQVARVIQYSN